MHKLPDPFRVSFFGVAAAKSGTTWIHECLAEHPEVYMPSIKELDFFSGPEGAPLEGYHSHFALARAGQLCGEISPSYGPHLSAAERIFAYNPKAKLIWMLREPVDRAYSHYCMACRSQEKILPVREVLDMNSDFVRYGHYVEQVRHFLTLFPRQQHLFLCYETLSRPGGPEAILKELYTFLGVNPDFVPSLIKTKVNTRKQLGRFPRAFGFAKQSALWLATRSSLFARALDRLRYSSWMGKIHKLNAAPVEFEPLPEDLRQNLQGHYRSKNKDLVALTGQSDFLAWN